ncbi:MAG: hypothetical protein ACOX0H_02545 [Patescibacteria group bacterium]|jgi:hypothetical protein|nr:hypothetical protein [bacterium]HQC49744.1 hypothetical protein [bacterium]
MKSEFASADLTAGQLNAIVEKLGGREGALRFLRDETLVTEPKRKWREQDGSIYFSVTSDRTTGKEWIVRLMNNGFKLSDYATSILCSKEFKPSLGTTTEIVVLKDMFCDNNIGLFSDWGIKNIRFKVANSKFVAPNAEVTCLIREAFSDAEMKLMGLGWIFTMHEPILDSDNKPLLLGISCRNGGSLLASNFDISTNKVDRIGLAFALPPASGS